MGLITRWCPTCEKCFDDTKSDRICPTCGLEVGRKQSQKPYRGLKMCFRSNESYNKLSDAAKKHEDNQKQREFTPHYGEHGEK